MKTYKNLNEAKSELSVDGDKLLDELIKSSVALASSKFKSKLVLKDAYFNKSKNIIELQFRVKDK